MESDLDTITAIATAAGEAGIAILRISGPAALAVADRILDGRSPPLSRRASHSAFLARVRGNDGRALDQALVLPMRAPRSYTGEDVVEIQCHGGRAITRRILAAVCDAGARMAEPGEFTRRAFLNGRLDLLQAEAVLDLVRAQSDRAAAAAAEQLSGRMSVRVNDLYDATVAVAADLESAIDFNEDVDGKVIATSSAARISVIIRAISDLLGSAAEGRLLREGVRVAIAGPPNAGKSTLFNALLGFDRAIVTPHPGTTRDTLEESLLLSGILVRLTDTAGLRTTDCAIEIEGVRRSKSMIMSSDYVVYVIDARFGFSESDSAMLASIPEERRLLVFNKADLVLRNAETPPAVYGVSAITGAGLDALRRGLAERIGSCVADATGACVGERHVQQLKRALNHLRAAADLLIGEKEDALLPVAIHLRGAAQRIGEITGREYHPALLDAIFKQFCVGK